MTRPLLEIADLIRTAALDGHLVECTRCAHRPPISYNSCRNRHCLKCQIAARERWIAARGRELLPTRYLHVVFTLPHYLGSLVLHHKKVLYDLLLEANQRKVLRVRSCSPDKSERFRR